MNGRAIGILRMRVSLRDRRSGKHQGETLSITGEINQSTARSREFAPPCFIFRAEVVDSVSCVFTFCQRNLCRFQRKAAFTLPDSGATCRFIAVGSPQRYHSRSVQVCARATCSNRQISSILHKLHFQVLDTRARARRGLNIHLEG